MMFDFFDYNFSSLISIFAALMGMAYPLILQAIQRIDEMYGSTKLAAFFQEQWFFRLFSVLLLLTIPVSVVAPFVLYYYSDYGCMMVVSVVHAIIVFALSISVFILFKYIVMTTSPNVFMKYLDNKLNGTHPPLTEIFQILKYASDKEDDELFGNVAVSINACLTSYRKNKRDDVAAEVWKMLRELYKQHSMRDNHFFSTRNLIATYFFPVGEQVDLSEDEYIYLWQTVDTVVHTNNELWVYAYWTYADQYYRFTLDHYADGNKELKWQQERFKEQHFMIGALMIYNQKYALLSQLMFFSNTMPPGYVLVPSSFRSVISHLKSLLKMKNYPLNLTKRYIMIGAPQDVSSDEFILRYAYKYTSLLLIRLFTVNSWNFTYSDPMKLLELPDSVTVEYLNDEVYMMNRLKNEVSLWFKEKDAIKQAIGEGRVSMNEVMELCNKYINQCENRIKELNNSMAIDPKKQKYLKSHLLSALKEYPLALPTDSNIDIDGYERRNIQNYVKFQVDKEVLKIGTNINASNLPDVIVEYLNELAYKAYNYLFLLQSSVRTIRIAYRDIKCVFDEIGVTEDFIALSLGVYLGNYELLCGKEGDEKFVEQNGYLSYRGCDIYSIPSTQQCIVVMKKCDMPFIKKEELADSHDLELIDEDEYFYSNIDMMKELSKDNDQFLLVDRGLYLYSKEQFRYIRLDINHNSGYETEMKKVKEAREIAWS